ncbi:MAG TPA: helix-turn-helix domain-containing protein [Gemmatimonadaceae bacterium]|jgi:excisionase family DNA binding protein
MSKDDFLTVSEAARELGVAPETVRRYEAQGRLVAERTPGGQRRYRRSVVERLRARASTQAEVASHQHHPAVAPARETEQAPPAPAAVPPWEARRANAEADLDVTRAEIARRQEVRQYLAEQRSREDAARALERDRAAAALAEAQARAAEARAEAEREQAAQREKAARDNCVAMIRIRMSREPSAVCAEVERYLAEHARVGVPLHLIEAECAAILDRHHATRKAEERAKTAAAAELIRQRVQRSQLLSHGGSYALLQTRDAALWGPYAALEAREAIRRRLDEVVCPDWTERRVEQEVDDVLSEWV